MFEWKPSYSVRIASLDGQHQNLFRLAGQLQAAIAAGHSQELVGELLERLLHYTQVHFQEEERMMERAYYPGLESHKTKHEALVRRVRELLGEYRNGNARVSITVLLFLKNWLEGHIMNVDQEYVPSLTANADTHHQ